MHRALGTITVNYVKGDKLQKLTHARYKLGKFFNF